MAATNPDVPCMAEDAALDGEKKIAKPSPLGGAEESDAKRNNKQKRQGRNNNRRANVSRPEPLDLNASQQDAYASAMNRLEDHQRPATFLAPIPSVVSVTEPSFGSDGGASSTASSTAAAAAEMSSSSGTLAASGGANTNASAVASLPASTNSNNSAAMYSRVYRLQNNNNSSSSNQSNHGTLTFPNPHQQQQQDPALGLPVTIVTPTKGHHALYSALEKLEGYEKEEQSLVRHAPLTAQLTELLTGVLDDTPNHDDAIVALQRLETAGKSVPRRVCQHPFKKNDIVWVCRTCQADETCVLCHACFSQSNHDGHDVAFYHAQAGGCCDCGDPDAWDPAGFCPHHGPAAAAAALDQQQRQQQNTTQRQQQLLPSNMVHRVHGVIPAVVDWMVHAVAMSAEKAFLRAHHPYSWYEEEQQRERKIGGNNNNDDNEREEDGKPSADDPIKWRRHKRRRRRRKQRRQQLALQLQQQRRAVMVLNEDVGNRSSNPNSNSNNSISSMTSLTSQQPSSETTTAAAASPMDIANDDTAVGNANDGANIADGGDGLNENVSTDEDDSSDWDEDDDIISSSEEEEDIDDDVEFPFPAGSFRIPRAPQVFSPAAASANNRSRNNSNDGDPIIDPANDYDTLMRGDIGLGIGSGGDSATEAATAKLQNAAAEHLGRIGRTGRGLYIVLHADDIHSTQTVLEALREFLGSASYFTDTLLSKLVRCLRQYGQLVVWGCEELLVECGSVQVQLWMDGDAVATAKIGAVVLDRCQRLTRHGLFCSIVTRDELMQEQRAVAVLQWMSCVARSCDPLCCAVAECILPQRHLVPLLRADFKMSARVTKAWYSLLLTLLAVPTFKSHLAAAYCDTYRAVTAKYARGMGVLERSGYTLSVQFLNRVTYVVDLVQGRDLLGKLGTSLLETLQVAAIRPRTIRGKRVKGSHKRKGRLDPNHFVLTHRRYSPCISDLKCVLNVAGMPRLFACCNGTFLHDWLSALSAAQFMDAQTWRHWHQGHVEDESRGWVGAFNASISLGSLFERLLGWRDEEVSPIQDPTSPLSRDLMPACTLTLHILTTGIDVWQRSELPHYGTASSAATADLDNNQNNSFMDQPHFRTQASLPMSTIASKRGTALAIRQVWPVSQMTPFSFHLPLHRFCAAAFRELCLRQNEAEYGMTALVKRIRRQLTTSEQDQLFAGLVEFPSLVLTRAAQVRAGLWRRNGPGLSDQVLNYAEPPFCRNMRDADLLMMQFTVLGQRPPKNRPGLTDVGMASLVHLLLHRLGIFNFCGLAKAPNSDISRYLAEVKEGLYSTEKCFLQSNINNNSDDNMDEDSNSGGDSSNKDFMSTIPASLPWTYSPARDGASSVVLLEEFLHLMIVFSTELPAFTPTDKLQHTEAAKLRLHREVVHRLASGPKTHSELSEVHHVLSHWDNVLLSEEGKLVNPDDATGAALAAVLEKIAERRVSRAKMEPDKWQLRQAAWCRYDPAFFHISLRNHQQAAENRPKPLEERNALQQKPPQFLSSTGPDIKEIAFGWQLQPYAPKPAAPHIFFERLRRDVTADATVLAISYRVLHLHLRQSKKDLFDLRGKAAYESREKSETGLARAVHLYTLGAYAWKDDKDIRSSTSHWRERGGGSAGSVFYNWGLCSDDLHDNVPTATDWVAAALLSKPAELLDCDWYDGEECALQLLHRLALTGGSESSSSGFCAQDSSVRAGAAWLCDFCVKNSEQAAALIVPTQKRLGTSASDGVTASQPGAGDDTEQEETEMQRRIRAAKEKAMAKMKAQAAKFSSMMDVDLDDDNHNEESTAVTAANADAAPTTPHRPIRSGSVGSAQSGGSQSSSISMGYASCGDGESSNDTKKNVVPPRLLRSRPRCIICNDEESSDSRPLEQNEHLFEHLQVLINETGSSDGKFFGAPITSQGLRKKSRRKTENALAFVGYCQASTVLKGGGGPPPVFAAADSCIREFVGAHVSLCGHAVHSECYESYLASVSDNRHRSSRDEFKCPLCQRLSNCLVPFIDVGLDWIDTPNKAACTPLINVKQEEDDMAEDTFGSAMQLDSLPSPPISPRFSQRQSDFEVATLTDFLCKSPWWVSRHNQTVVWDGQSAFIDRTSIPTATGLQISEGGAGKAIDKESDSSRKPSARRRSVRALSKKDLYAAWNAMMRTPRLVVRRRLRPRTSRHLTTAASNVSRVDGPVNDASMPLSGSAATAPNEILSSSVFNVNTNAAATGASRQQRQPAQEESGGETVVWRRFMDQVADISYKADSKRLGDENLHALFGEFRHYHIEKNAYNMANRLPSIQEWPACMFQETPIDSRRQEMSREKVLSKLLLTIQSFAYSVACEAFEARRAYFKAKLSFSAGNNSNTESTPAPGTGPVAASSVRNKFGIEGLACLGRMVILPPAVAAIDDGFQPFSGRLGKLRYLALAVMSAAGAVAADLVQLVMPFPTPIKPTGKESATDTIQDTPIRAPIAYPLLFGNVFSHTVAAMCAVAGRGRAKSEQLDNVFFGMPFSTRSGSWSVCSDSDFLATKNKKQQRSTVDAVTEDCEGFLKLGLVARTLQVLLAQCCSVSTGCQNPMAVVVALKSWLAVQQEKTLSSREERSWVRFCVGLLEIALSSTEGNANGGSRTPNEDNEFAVDEMDGACLIAVQAASSFLVDVLTVMQLIVPGVLARYDEAFVCNKKEESKEDPIGDENTGTSLLSCCKSFDKMWGDFLKFEPLEEMMQSDQVKNVVANWYHAACRHARIAASDDSADLDDSAKAGALLKSRLLKSLLYRTHGFRGLDWPSVGAAATDHHDIMTCHSSSIKPSSRDVDVIDDKKKPAISISVEDQPHNDHNAMQIESVRSSPALVTFGSKKTVPLLGGFCSDLSTYAVSSSKTAWGSISMVVRPRVAVIPTSYTDLYAELGALLPDSEQTAVCLICGEVLNAGGKGECTRHSYKCGAGAGMFFLLQDCNGLIMHKSKAAYIHSPYVDSHGETPQYRGRPLNLDLDRYEHLREVWYGHAVRQQVLAERTNSRQVIVQDFY